MEYGNLTENVLFRNAVLASLMSGRKYDDITQKGDCSRETNVRNLVLRNKMQSRYRTQYGKDPPSDNAVRRWLQQFQETGGVVAPIKTQQMLENTWREIEYRLQILCAMKGAQVQVV
jgi:hypothetical protein